MATKRKKTTSSSKTGPAKKQSKAAFIRALPMGISAKDAVAAGAKQGVKFSEAYFYNARRGFSTKKTTASKAKPGPKPNATNGAATARSSSPSQETTFRRLVLDIGLSRARGLLDEVEKKLAALISGR